MTGISPSQRACTVSCCHVLANIDLFPLPDYPEGDFSWRWRNSGHVACLPIPSPNLIPDLSRMQPVDLSCMTGHASKVWRGRSAWFSLGQNWKEAYRDRGQLGLGHGKSQRFCTVTMLNEEQIRQRRVEMIYDDIALGPLSNLFHVFLQVVSYFNPVCLPRRYCSGRLTHPGIFDPSVNG